MTKPLFPINQMPNESAQARLLGIYPQRHEGHLLQRVKTPGGRITIDQWRAVTRAARLFSSTGVLHLTTRQDVEIHGLNAKVIPDVQKILVNVGLSTVGAAGDTPRNITISPESGLTPDQPDLLPMAQAIVRALDSLPFRYELPRKFKISLSSDTENDARPWMNDLGFILKADGTFRVVVAGSLGVRPVLGIAAYDELTGRDVLALAVAAVRLFNVEGDRANRSRARLRHVRERVGNGPFLKMLDEYFQEARREKLPEAPVLTVPEKGVEPLIRLHLPHGHMDCEAANDLADAVQTHRGEIRIGLEHDLLIAGLEAAQLPEPLAELSNALRMVVCPGAHTCSRGIAETWPVAKTIGQVLPPDSDLFIGISGCPNNCAHAAIADIGLLGKIKTVAGDKVPHFRLMVGGGHGAGPALARQLHTAVPSDRIGEIVRWLAEAWTEIHSHQKILFREFIDREWTSLSDQVADMSTLARE